MFGDLFILFKYRFFLIQTKITFRFVLYQLSKNLNRSFFMDFLIELRWTILQNISNLVFASVRHATDPVTMDDQDPDSGAWDTN